MKRIVALTTLMFIVFGCSSNQTGSAGERSVSDPKPAEDKIFKQLSVFPNIKDTSAFIADLRESFDLEVEDNPGSAENEKISFYGKVNIYGSDKDFYLVEYDYGSGSMASFPWKYQLLLTAEGKLVKLLSGMRFELIQVIPKQNPFLLAVTSTSKGNGGHELYKVSADSLENVYEGYYDYAIQTYDAHQDNAVFEPNELKIFINDDNKDGYNDIGFSGKIVLIQGRSKSGNWYDGETINGRKISYSVDNPFKKAPIEFIFLYDKETGHFKAKEDYGKKYKEFEY
jgi:hypothetical protein